MKIKEIIIKDFGGIEMQIIKPEKLTFLLGKNGTSKTTILKAIKRAFLGKMEESDIREGAKAADVTIVFEDDSTVERIRKQDRTTVKVNDKTTTEKSATAFLEDKLGASLAVYQAMFGTDYFKAISKNELSSLILSMLQVHIDSKTIIDTAEAEMDVLEDNVKKYIIQAFPSGEFGIDTIDEVAKKISTQLTEEKRTLDTYKKKSTFDKTVPKESREDLEKLLRQNMQKIAEYQATAKQEQEMKRLQEQRTQAIQRKENLEQEYRTMENVQKPDQTAYDTAVSDKQKFKKAIRAANGNISNAQANMSFQQKLVNNITNANHSCPLCSGIQCRTDMTPYITQAKDLIAQNQSVVIQNQNFIKKCEEQITKRDSYIQNYQKLAMEYQKKEMLGQQIKNFVIPNIPKLPEISEKEDLSVLQEQQNLIQARIQAISEYTVAMDYKKKCRDQQDKVDMLKKIVIILDTKTGVRSMIIKKILEPFRHACEAVSRQLNPDMELMFSYDKGLDVYMRKQKDAEFIPISNISTGEFVFVAFVLMTVIGQLTQTHILVLDNLDSLDNDNLGQLITLLENDTTFQNVFMAAVNHTDTMKTLENFNDVQTILM